MSDQFRYPNLTKDQINYITKIPDLPSETKRLILLALDSAIGSASGGGGSGVSSWIDLNDTDPTTFAGAAGEFVRVNVGETGLEFAVPPDTNTDAFLDLTDVTESSYSGEAGNLVAVNLAEDGLEFIAPASGGGSGFEWVELANSDTVVAEPNKGYIINSPDCVITLPDDFEDTNGTTDQTGYSKYPIMIYTGDRFGGYYPVDIDDYTDPGNYFLNLEHDRSGGGGAWANDFVIPGNCLCYLIGYRDAGEGINIIWDVRYISRGIRDNRNDYAHGIVGWSETLVGPGTLDNRRYKSNLETNGAAPNAYTLQDGLVHGQLKLIELTAGARDAVVTPTNFEDGTTITFTGSNIGQCCLLQWSDLTGSWHLADLYRNSNATPPAVA